MIAGYGIPTVVYRDDYKADEGAKEIFKFYNIDLLQVTEEDTKEFSLEQPRCVTLEDNNDIRVG